MKKIKYWVICMVTCFMSMALFLGCNSTSNTNELGGGTMINYYKMEDFQSITIGESTYYDVYKVAPTGPVQITSYGGFCEYPMQNGGCIRIKFCGESLIVGAIEEIERQGDGSVVP